MIISPQPVFASSVSGSNAAIKVIGQKRPDVVYVDHLAVLAILVDLSTNNIVLIHVVKGNYYKLPGCGIEASEDHGLAVAREALEETGWTMDVTLVGECFATSEE